MFGRGERGEPDGALGERTAAQPRDAVLGHHHASTSARAVVTVPPRKTGTIVDSPCEVALNAMTERAPVRAAAPEKSA